MGSPFHSLGVRIYATHLAVWDQKEVAVKCKFEYFNALVELHKYYLDLLISSESFYLGIVGAVVAYVAKVSLSPWQTRITLVVPAILSSSVSWGYFSGYYKLQELAGWIQSCSKSLELGWAPHSEILAPLSLLFAGIAAFLSIGIGTAFAFPCLIERAKNNVPAPSPSSIGGGS